jgi:hypothetical protein
MDLDLEQQQPVPPRDTKTRRIQESVSMLEAQKLAHFLGLVQCKEHALCKKIERDVIKTAMGVYGHLLKHHSDDGSVANEHRSETKMAGEEEEEEEERREDVDAIVQSQPVTEDAIAGGCHTVRHAATVI